MYNVYGVQCATYEEACIVAGVDTPEQIRADEAYDAMIANVIGDEFYPRPLLNPPYCPCMTYGVNDKPIVPNMGAFADEFDECPF